jgi:malonate decarboxylase delta subunit
MQKLNFSYSATESVLRRAHIGVVGSGDLEVLLEPSNGQEANVTVRTSVDGYDKIWKAVLDRFFDRNNVAAAIEINDFGATPGVVMLRLQQALRESRS